MTGANPSVPHLFFPVRYDSGYIFGPEEDSIGQLAGDCQLDLTDIQNILNLFAAERGLSICDYGLLSSHQCRAIRRKSRKLTSQSPLMSPATIVSQGGLPK